MRLKGIVVEDFIQYKHPSLFLITASCNFKCCKEAGNEICQNLPLNKAKIVDFSNDYIYNLYVENNITKSIVLGGLEPFDQFDEVIDLISYFREKDCRDNFVIYTGYYPEEVDTYLSQLKNYSNIVVKFGRFIPNSVEVYDELLGVKLASKNQFSLQIS